MESDQSVGTLYCLEHERFCAATLGANNQIYHMEVSIENTISDDSYIGYDICFGPFTNIAPPAPLSEEEWRNIISQERDHIQWQ